MVTCWRQHYVNMVSTREKWDKNCSVALVYSCAASVLDLFQSGMVPTWYQHGNNLVKITNSDQYGINWVPCLPHVATCWLLVSTWYHVDTNIIVFSMGNTINIEAIVIYKSHSFKNDYLIILIPLSTVMGREKVKRCLLLAPLSRSCHYVRRFSAENCRFLCGAKSGKKVKITTEILYSLQ